MNKYKKIELIDKEIQEFKTSRIIDYERVLLRMESTNHCNFKCTFCPHPQMKRKKGFMDEDLFYKTIDQAADLGIIKLDLRNFGEPMLDKRLGRMANEDIPAIADQMIHEFGADRAATFKDSAEQVLNQALESSKVAKEGVNQLVGGITGQDMNAGGLGDTAELGDIDSDLGGDSIDDLAIDEPEMDMNEPAAAGPEEEPLGRAPVEG